LSERDVIETQIIGDANSVPDVLFLVIETLAVSY